MTNRTYQITPGGDLQQIRFGEFSRSPVHYIEKGSEEEVEYHRALEAWDEISSHGEVKPGVVQLVETANGWRFEYLEQTP